MPPIPAWRALLAACLVVPLLATPAQGQGASEPAVKAGFVYNVAKFIEWPSNALSATAIDLCMPGGDPFGAVTQLLQGKTLQGHTVMVHRNVRSDDLRACDIVYITDVDEHRQVDALRAVRGLPILSIGDGETFTEIGGVIGLVSADERVQFEISYEAAQRSGLRINAQLMKLARNVKGRP